MRLIGLYKLISKEGLRNSVQEASTRCLNRDIFQGIYLSSRSSGQQ